MSRKRDTSPGTLEVDLTPMIDMVFQLIIFFMVLINFTQADQDQRIVLPKSELAKPPDKPQENLVTVNLAKDGQVFMAGQAYTTDTFQSQLKVERENVVRQGESPKNVTIVIRAHKLAKTGDVQKVILECQKPEIGFEKFTLRAEEQQ